MLQTCRSTAHPSTGKTPFELLMNRQVRTNLDHFPTKRHDHDEETRHKDANYKKKIKNDHDRRYHANEHKLRKGDAVVVKRENKRKGQTPYEPYIYLTTRVKGTQIKATRIKDERKMCEDASKLKQSNSIKSAIQKKKKR